MKDMMIGVNLAKNVFVLHGALRTGGIQFCKKLTRKQFHAFMVRQAPCLVIFEACGGAHFWAREMEALGHNVRLIAPQYARPFVKRQKNDMTDAEAIVIAARQPEMRFVAPKTAEQQSRTAVFRNRERLVHQRTEDVNALRALLYEHGHVFPIGIRFLDHMRACRDGRIVSRSWSRPPHRTAAIAFGRDRGTDSDWLAPAGAREAEPRKGDPGFTEINPDHDPGGNMNIFADRLVEVIGSP